MCVDDRYMQALMFEVSRQLWLWSCIACNQGISIPAEMIVLSGGLGGVIGS
jgi:hypothetical protein